MGNPTSKYKNTRHNVGFDAVDYLSIKMKKKLWRPFYLGTINKTTFVKPLTYMNLSGTILKYFIPKKYPKDDLIVVCDNLDLEVGRIRIRQGGSTAGHKGLQSIVENIGTTEFIRIYIGIGRPEKGITVIEHVLSKPTNTVEQEKLNQGIKLASEALLDFAKGKSFVEVANVYNRRQNNNSS